MRCKKETFRLNIIGCSQLKLLSRVDFEVTDLSLWVALYGGAHIDHKGATQGNFFLYNPLDPSLIL